MSKGLLCSYRRSRVVVALSFSLLVILASAGMSAAQSGRRLPSKPKQPSPVIPSESETPPPAPPEKRPEIPQTPVLVVKYSSVSSGGYYYGQYVLDGCIGRMKESGSLKVRTGKEMNSKEASDYAKASADNFVVWLDLDLDSLGVDASQSGRDITVRYAVYTPGTGKVKTQGRVYLRPYQARIGGVGLPVPVPNGRAQGELVFKQAGEDIAERVMDSFGTAPGR